MIGSSPRRSSWIIERGGVSLFGVTIVAEPLRHTRGH
jgi:hypothetical protein